MKKVSASSTKNDILEAYEEMLAYLNEQKMENATLKKDLLDKSKIVAQAKSNVENANPIETLDAIGISFIKQVEELKSKMLQEKQKFEEIEQAISLEKNVLEDIYGIKVEAESLEALIATHKLAKERLELEIKQGKENWDVELKQAKEKLVEDIKQGKEEWKAELKQSEDEWLAKLAQSKQEKQREEEDYLYNLKIGRRNDEDAYLQKKSKLEQELQEQKASFEKETTERENELKAREEELVALREKEKTYQKNIDEAIAKTEKEISTKLKTEYEYKQKLENKEMEVQLKLYQQEIELLKAKSTEQQVIISELNEKSSKASDQVKDIALKAIEGASVSRWNGEKNERREEKRE
jgi:colicin import membrane protein